MSPFDSLLVAHLIGDYLFQTSWMAMNKAKKWDALFVHCLVYTLTIWIVAWLTFGGLSVWGILFIFLTHLFLDRRTFILWWTRNIMKTGDNPGWLAIMADQVFHIIVLAVAIYI